MDKKQKILIIGGGGREHAIGWKIAQSPREPLLYFAPGNAGTLDIGINVDIKANDINGLLEFAKKEKIDLTLAIPDDPLALGIVDLFKENNMRIFGPTKNAAQLESSKAFAKKFMASHDLPTAKFMTFTDYDTAKIYLNMQRLPIVIKASGLALGKGVFICNTKEEAERALENMMLKKVFGEAGNEVVIEEFLTGPEISTHAFTDGKNYSFFPTAQDHKRIGENDTGENTGGMGTIAPLPFVDENLIQKIQTEIVEQTINSMHKDGNTFEGVIYPGLMLTEEGPKILEYNARFGDPETQTYMRLLETDLLDIIDACIDKKLSNLEIKWSNKSACTIVLASGGYPANYEKGKEISGIQQAESNKNVKVFHAGTIMKEGALVTNGGRVLGVSAIGESLQQALDIAYEAVNKISFDDMQYRRDIGKRALELSK